MSSKNDSFNVAAVLTLPASPLLDEIAQVLKAANG